MDQLEYRLRDKIKQYLDEDIGYGDITSETLIPATQHATGRLYFKEPGTISGLPEASTVFKLLGCTVENHAIDGDKVEAKQTLLSVEGSARALLMGERLALNIVGRMSGIATQTSKIVNEIMTVNPDCIVAATRKTLPGFREFDKRAVVHGGGDPHRFRLDDCVLIKDNHLELVPSVTEAVQRARRGVSFTKMIEIEVRSMEDAVEAIEAGADIVMLDNMNPSDIKACLTELTSLGLRDKVLIEASGGITPMNAALYAESGVDVISLGALTHSIRSLDVKFEIEMN